MTDRTRTSIGRSLAAIGVVASVVGTVWLTVIGEYGVLMDDWVLHNAVVALGLGSIAFLVIGREPRNGAIWVSVWVSLFTGLYCLVEAVARQLMASMGITGDLLAMTPSELPVSIALLVMMTTWLYQPIFLAVTIGFLIFPDGALPSPRWRWVPWTTVISLAVAAVGIAIAFRPSGVIPYSVAVSSEGTFRDLGPVVAIAEWMSIAVVPICLSGMILRFRRSAGAIRQQFRWVVWGAGVGVLVSVPAIVFDAVTRSSSARFPFLFSLTVIIVSYGVAIGRYRLYDVDVVISRTFVYTTLALFIGAVYVTIVVGFGFLLGTHDDPEPALGILATVAIAIAFQPLRRRLQRVANRIVYGKRATPYEVLSTFSQRVDAVDPEVLAQIARSLAEGTTATAASIWLRRGEALARVASWPPDLELPRIAASLASLPGADRSAEVRHDGEQLGAVALGLPAGRPFAPPDARLLEQVASGLGLALRNMLLTEDLRSRVEQLRESRRRIVAVQDRTRRTIERDLHDGAQQRLVALKIKLGIGTTMAQKIGLDDVAALLSDLGRQTDETIDSVRDFARGIYPPLLEAEGLAAALTAQLRKVSRPVTVQASGLSRYERDLEATAYFCVLQAVQNAVEHADARSIFVLLDESEGTLVFEVRDDGSGFDTEASTAGTGLLNIADRLDAVEGRLEVRSTPGHGTVVRGEMPLRETVTG